MLQITIPAQELFNEATNQFINTKEWMLQLEHSLVSISKWESKWCIPFLKSGDKTREQTIDYVRCMTITQNVSPEVYNFITQKNIDDITDYIQAPMTATTFKKDINKTINREIITAELIYYWMIAFNIPFECQKWHLNRLLTLVNVCNVKNQPTKKRNAKDVLKQNKALNDARKSKYNTSG